MAPSLSRLPEIGHGNGLSLPPLSPLFSKKFRARHFTSLFYGKRSVGVAAVMSILSWKKTTGFQFNNDSRDPLS